MTDKEQYVALAVEWREITGHGDTAEEAAEFFDTLNKKNRAFHLENLNTHVIIAKAAGRCI